MERTKSNKVMDEEKFSEYLKNPIMSRNVDFKTHHNSEPAKLYMLGDNIDIHPPTIMTHDPSICAWGVVIIDYSGNIIYAECIKTEGTPAKKRRIRKGDDDVRRMTEIIDFLLSLIEKYNVQFMFTELPHGSQNAAAAKMIGAVSGIVQTISQCMKIGVEWYSEGDSKHHLLGKRSAVKKETINAIKKLYNVPWTNIGFRDEAIADAISIYHLALMESPVLKMLKMK